MDTAIDFIQTIHRLREENATAYQLSLAFSPSGLDIEATYKYKYTRVRRITWVQLESAEFPCVLVESSVDELKAALVEASESGDDD